MFTREVVFSVSSPAAGARQEHITGIPVRGDREVLRWQALSMRVHGSIPDFADRLADELGLVDLNEVAALLGESELSVGRAGGEVLVCRQEVLLGLRILLLDSRHLLGQAIVVVLSVGLQRDRRLSRIDAAWQPSGLVEILGG